MLKLTSRYRKNIIDHVMPSDLDPDDIKHGLYLKELMIDEITDDYVKKNVPNWEDVEKQTEDIPSFLNGEIENEDLKKFEAVKTELWYHTKRKLDDEWSDWKQATPEGLIEFSKITDFYIQMKIVIRGDNCDRYYPLHDYSHPSGWEYKSDDIHQYSPKTKNPNEEFWRLFFKNRPGYDEFDWHKEDVEWNQQHYGDEKVFTLLCDVFQLRYVSPQYYGSTAVLSGKQWLQCDYQGKTMYSVVLITIKIDNMNVSMD